MLEVAVLLVASAALPGAAGAVVMPSGPAQSVSERLFDGDLVQVPHETLNNGAWSWALAPSPKADPTLIPKLAGSALLQQLALLDRAELAAFLAESPDSVEQLLLDPPPAGETERWWNSLTIDAQHTLTGAAPEIVGNLPGVPFSTRNVTNRSFLTETIARLEAQRDSGVGRAAQAEIDARLSMLHEVQNAIDPAGFEAPRALLSLDTVWPGRAAISVGNMRTADYVSYLVPGMFFTIEGQVGDWTKTAVELYAEQNDWIKLLGEQDPQLAGKTVATVAWMGYETPNLFTVGSDDQAEIGALYLKSSMDALFNQRKDARPFVSILAHSYGSTAAMNALVTGSFEIDSFAVVGSPGSSAKSVDELHVRGRNVYVGEASWDPVIGTGFFGANPGAPSYGAHRMSVAGGADLITHDPLAASVGHNEYFAPGSESFRNMALIGIDRGSLVSDGSGLDVERTMAYFDRLI